MNKIISLIIMSLFFTSCVNLKGKAPAMEDLGIRFVEKSKGFKPCPKKPNCVSSFPNGNDPKNVMEHITTSADREKTMEVATKIILKTKGARLVQQNSDYFKVEYTTPVLGFVDDAEFYFGQRGRVHFKSWSRMGYYDFGANKKRMEEFKFKFHQSGL